MTPFDAVAKRTSFGKKLFMPIANDVRNNECNRHVDNHLKPKLATPFYPTRILLVLLYPCLRIF
jgi:hypothetical protein